MGKYPHEPDTQQPLLIAEQQHRELCKQEIMNINYEAPTAETTRRSSRSLPPGPTDPLLESILQASHRAVTGWTADVLVAVSLTGRMPLNQSPLAGSEDDRAKHMVPQPAGDHRAETVAIEIQTRGSEAEITTYDEDGGSAAVASRTPSRR